MKRSLIAIALGCLLLAGCGGRSRNTEDQKMIYVSILPLRGIVEDIVGDDFRVEVLVPPGASPETFELTPRQMVDLDRAELVFGIGWLDFEQNMLSKIEDRSKVIALSEGVEPIAGSCSHVRADEGHSHGVDPHIWTSPRELRTMAENAYRAIHTLYPDSLSYTARNEALDRRLTTLDETVAERLNESGVSYFMIYHPALTYYARAYGVEQVVIEQEGKEPSARRLALLIDRARRDSIHILLYQSQFPASTVEVIASDMGADSRQIDPLAEDVEANILEITDLIVSSR